MGDKTGIEWTDATWNPTTGCDRVSPGCDNCYAMTLAPRLKAMGSAHYQTDGNPQTSGQGFGFAMHEDALDKPIRWKRPRKIFVNSMSDLFHKEAPDEFIARVFAVMAIASQHTFQILTKRPGRMRSLLSAPTFSSSVAYQGRRHHIGGGEDWLRVGAMLNGTPLPNVWLGTSVEDQKWADVRGELLRKTPAAVRFFSAEPLLGPIVTDLTGIDWVIVGGESGKGARPMHIDWVRQLRDQCNEAAVPFLFKQWGSHDATGNPMNKHDAGRELDGRTWDEFPEVVSS